LTCTVKNLWQPFETGFQKLENDKVFSLTKRQSHLTLEMKAWCAKKLWILPFIEISLHAYVQEFVWLS